MSDARFGTQTDTQLGVAHGFGEDNPWVVRVNGVSRNVDDASTGLGEAVALRPRG